jgi:hypothetical protein
MAGLPDFSWYNIPKTGKKLPNDHKMYQIAIRCTKLLSNIPNGQKIYKQCPYQGTPIYIPTPKLDFWYKNIPSGNTYISMV